MPETEQSLRLIDILSKGGWLMLPLILLSFIALFVYLERYFTISKAQRVKKNLFNDVKNAIYNGDVKKALQICRSDNTMISRILMVGINNIGNPIESIKSTLEDFANLEVYYLEKRLSYLSIIAGSAPMIGFLGTVIGMIRAFLISLKEKEQLICNFFLEVFMKPLLLLQQGSLSGFLHILCTTFLFQKFPNQFIKYRLTVLILLKY